MDATEFETARSLSPETFARLERFITGELGIKMPEHKSTMVESRLLRRVRELGLTSVEQYGRYFFETSSTVERQHLIDAITTNKTDFFREPAHFACLTNSVIPSLQREKRRSAGSRFQVWSAGCSTGEEPYTLAMVLSNYAAATPAFDFHILGTDISTRVLERARNAIYTESQIAPLPSELREKYVWRGRRADDSRVRIAPAVRQRVTFHQLNFMDEDYGVRDVFDAIFFRNVMIYFDRDTQEAVINKLCRNLAPGGYFFVGHSESLAGMNCRLDAVDAAVFRKPGN
jgi:chemotaxis protein methyltransferase CheR